MNPNPSTPFPPCCPPAVPLQLLVDGGGKESSSLSVSLLAKARSRTVSKDEMVSRRRCSGKHPQTDFYDGGWGKVVSGGCCGRVKRGFRGGLHASASMDPSSPSVAACRAPQKWQLGAQGESVRAIPSCRQLEALLVRHLMDIS